MQVMNQLNDKYDDKNDKLKTVVLSKKNYDKLKELGFTGDSFNTVVGRLLEKIEDDN